MAAAAVCWGRGSGGFNGAALTGARMAQADTCRSWRSRRFNGAALTGARMDLRSGSIRDKYGLLQRGRAHGGADGRLIQDQARKQIAASTGPRSRGRGWSPESVRVANYNILLQRGRAHGGADGSLAVSLCTDTIRLQRGRAHGGADGRGTNLGIGHAFCFNGAALTGARMEFDRRRRHPSFPCFNGAALTGARMDPTSGAAPRAGIRLQRGRAHGGADGDSR